MEKYTLDKYDFKKYLLNQLSDARQDELIFWKNEIPLPLDLLYGIFEKRDKLFRTYIDHIAGVYLFAYCSISAKGKCHFDIAEIPSKGISKYDKELEINFRSNIKASNVMDVTYNIANVLMVNDYILDPKVIIIALSHEGRKYKRLYLPKQLKEIVKKFNNSLLEKICVSNGDMFGNVVADELGIYRSGFSDAFAVIFNKLLDFVIENNRGNHGYSTNSIKIAQSSVLEEPDMNANYGKIIDGSVWEPSYKNARTVVTLNTSHPFFQLIKKSGQAGEQLFKEIFQVMAEIENEKVKDSERRVLEIFRQEVSRKLRIESEKQL